MSRKTGETWGTLVARAVALQRFQTSKAADKSVRPTRAYPKMISLPRLYAILDASCFPDTAALCLAADELVAGGVTLLQYRNKSGNARQMLEQARELRRSSRELGEADHE